MIVDVDDASTWPDDVAAFVESAASRFSEADNYITDGIRANEEQQFCELLAERRVIAYHATRLLEIEATDIRERGLQLLSRELIMKRLQAAVAAGLLSVDEQQHLLENNFLASRDYAKYGTREGFVWLSLSTHGFRDLSLGTGYLIGEWGGEVVSFFNERTAYRQRLQSIGTPSIVVTAIDVAEAFHISPGVLAPCVAHRLGGTLGADVGFKTPIPANCILDIWQPGNSNYDRFAELPKS